MSLRSLCLAVSCLLLPTLAQALTMPALPPGMCALDAHVPEQAMVIDYLKNASKGSNELLATFARCDELTAITQKKANAITHFGTVMRQKLDQQIPPDRKAYVTAVAAMLSANGNQLMQTALTGARESAANGTADSGIANPKSIQSSSQGVLFQNDDMVIIGLQQSNNVGGQQVRIASTAAMTLLGGAPVSVNLYAPLGDPNAFQQSTTVLQPFVTQLIAANP